MKKGFTKIGLLALLGLLVACGTTTSETPSTTSEEGTTTSVEQTTEDVTTSEDQVTTEEGTTSEEPPAPSVNYGTAEAPLNVADAYALISSLGKDGVSTEKLFVRGIAASVTTGSSGQYKIDLKDDLSSSKYVQVYYGNIASGVETPVVGDVLVATGYAKNYNDYTMELAASNSVSPEVISVTHASYAITSSIENGTIVGLASEGLSGSTQEFTVTVNAGYKIASVKVNGVDANVVDEATNKYSFVVNGAMEVVVTIVAEGTIVSNTTLTAANVLGYTGAQIAYKSGSVSVDGVDYEYNELGCYGNGIQMRNKNGGSKLWNTTAFPAPIASIELTYDAAKDTYDNANAFIFAFGDSTDVSSATVNFSTVKGTKKYTITPDAQTYTYFKMTINVSYSFYWSSIVINYAV